MGWVSDKWYKFDIVRLKLSWGPQIRINFGILQRPRSTWSKHRVWLSTAMVVIHRAGSVTTRQNRCTCGQRRSTLSNDCPGKHHVTILWVEMLEPQTRTLEQIASPQGPHAIWDASSWWQAVWRTAKRFSKWCSTLPVASGRTQRLACRGDTPRHRHQAFAPKSAE